MKKENDLGRDKISSLVFRIALPSMLAQFVSVLYSIVDRIYIGNIPGTGDIALAGVGVCGPVVTMVGSAAFLIGIGGSPLMSIRLGEKNVKAAEKILANSFLSLCVISVILMAVVMPLATPMLRVFGASSVTLPYSTEYFLTYMMGTPFALLSVGMNQFVICQGYAKKGMKSVMIGAVSNIILDPIFIFIFDMGVKGAAIATVISQIASCIYVLSFLFGKKVPVKITFSGYSFKIIRKILVLGFSPFAIIALDNVMIIAMNSVLQHYGGPEQGDMLVTCATIVQSLMLVVTMPLGGITGGTQTILGYNYGARDTGRVKKAQRYIFLLCVAFTGIMFVLSWTCGIYFVRLFTSDPELLEETMKAVRICTLAIIPLGIQYEIVDGFTAMGQVKFSLPLSFWRKGIYFAAIFLLPMFFGAKAVFYAEPLSDIIGPAVSVIIYLIFMKRILKKRESASLIETEPPALQRV